MPFRDPARPTADHHQREPGGTQPGHDPPRALPPGDAQHADPAARRAQPQPAAQLRHSRPGADRAAAHRWVGRWPPWGRPALAWVSLSPSRLACCGVVVGTNSRKGASLPGSWHLVRRFGYRCSGFLLAARPSWRAVCLRPGPHCSAHSLRVGWEQRGSPPAGCVTVPPGLQAGVPIAQALVGVLGLVLHLDVWGASPLSGVRLSLPERVRLHAQSAPRPSPSSSAPSAEVGGRRPPGRGEEVPCPVLGRVRELASIL